MQSYNLGEGFFIDILHFMSLVDRGPQPGICEFASTPLLPCPRRRHIKKKVRGTLKNFNFFTSK